MKFNRLIGILVVLVVSVALVAGVSAQSEPYLRINNGQNISITPSETPQVVIQFGGGQSGLADAGILCVTLGDVSLTGQVYTHGAFPSFSIAPEGVAGGLADKAISFPSAFSFLGLADEFTTLNPGQNFNVAFNVQTAGQGGDVLCALVDGAAVASVAQDIELSPVDLTSQAVIDLVADVAIDLAAVSITTR